MRIFLPGFSTRSNATAISGRGIGLEPVHAIFTELGGDISVTCPHIEGLAVSNLRNIDDRPNPYLGHGMRQNKSVATLLALLISITALPGCDTFVRVPEGRIRIKNDFSGSQFSTFTVSGGGASFSLKAGDAVLLPKGTSTISFSYPGRDGHRSYRVQCPSGKRSGFTLKVLDVHSNRLPGGCETVWANR